MQKIRPGMVLAALALSSTAFALPTFVPVFNRTYAVKRSGTLDKAKCGICHIGSSSRHNPYGAALKKAIADEKTGGRKLTASVLKRVERLDSDKDGKKNIDEIRADKNPGDLRSK